MWLRAIIIGILIGFLFTAISLKAQPRSDSDMSQVLEKLDQVLKNQQDIFGYLKFIKNKV